MKVVIVNKSDSRGGAAVVSFRLMQALREAGVDARMLVAEKTVDSEFIDLASSPLKLKRAFLSERLGIFIANGLDRSTLFKIDTASVGVDISCHPWIKEADIVCLNWINQGLLSLKGISRLAAEGKRIFWTMHDMWCFTGICHHAGNCRKYEKRCHDCPLLGKRKSASDLSGRIQSRKANCYSRDRLHFIAVSHWLGDLARKSTLLSDMPLSVIPNAFPIEEYVARPDRDNIRPLRILFGAARLDDPVKGLPILVRMTRHLKENYPEASQDMELITFGDVKDPSSLEGIAIKARHLGMVREKRKLEELYRSSDIIVSTSLYETLPGTLVEGQAYGCVPVGFNRGGQSDIIDHLSTGFLARWSDNPDEAASSIAEGIIWAASQGEATRRRMHESVVQRFSARKVAEAYIRLFKNALKR